MKEIKPCPFCGGEAHMSASSDGYGVQCWNRRCIDLDTDSIATEAEAIEAWNTRVCEVIEGDGTGEALPEVRTCKDVNEEDNDFTCSECGASMYTQVDDCWTMVGKSGLCDDVIEHPNYCPNCGAKVVDE